jgi:L-rhamnose mutarotase
MRSVMIFGLALFLIFSCKQQSDHTLSAPEKSETAVRKGSVIKVKPEKLEYYKMLHANPWPTVDSMLKVCNIRNYSIYYRDGYLFSYLEYTGEDWEADMAKMAADSVTQIWWKETDPCQEPVESAGDGVWWADLEEVYHLD